MSEAFVYDAIRTPRGKGKKDGSLHEVKPVNLLAGVAERLQRRNDFDTGAGRRRGDGRGLADRRAGLR
jgi:acetyl-CoA C-acetyltransferase